MPKLKSKLPPLYQSFFPDFIEKEFPEEKWATCDTCNICRSPKSPYLNTKCCNYYPHLANYLVGGILQDSSPAMEEGKKRVRQLIKGKQGVTPYGILPPRWRKEQDKLPYNEQDKGVSTNNSDLVKCPYLDRGNCTIWDYRENLCSTHFCFSVGGRNGKEFWKATNGYLKMAENVLSNYALYQLGIPAETIKTGPVKSIDFGIETSDRQINQEMYSKLWQAWEGNEEDLYIRSYEIVASLDAQKFTALYGHNQVIMSQSIEELLDTFERTIIPDYLCLHPNLQVVQNSLSECILTLGDRRATINPIAYSFLAKFDGIRTTKSIIDHAYQIVLNLEIPIDELYRKGMLLTSVSIPNQEA